MKALRRLLKRFVIGLLVFIGILALIVYAGRSYFDQIGTRELNSINHQLDTEDPGWRLEAIEPARQQAAPPDEQNSARIVLKAAEIITPEKDREWNAWRNSASWNMRPLSPHLPRESFQKGMLTQKESTAAVRQIARGLRRFPNGYYTVTINKSPYMTLLPHLDKARQIAALLEYDALLVSLEGDTEGGIASVHATLNVARSVGAEPFLVSQLVRIACARVSTQTAMQVLAWGEPKRGLAELQAAYRAEADVPWLLDGLRGERATIHRTFEGLESGAITYDDIAVLGLQTPGPGEHGAFQLYKGLLRGDHAKALEILTQYIAAAKLPPHEQAAAFAAIPIPPGPPDDFRYILTRLLIPACEKVAAASRRVRAELLAAATIIACERYRQATGHWPERLEDIPKDVLPDVPLDPFNNQPLRYRQFSDGVAVFSVGNEQSLRRAADTHDPLAGIGLGWRMWNPDQRRQPALPEPKDAVNPDQPQEPKLP